MLAFKSPWAMWLENLTCSGRMWYLLDEEVVINNSSAKQESGSQRWKCIISQLLLPRRQSRRAYAGKEMAYMMPLLPIDEQKFVRSLASSALFLPSSWRVSPGRAVTCPFAHRWPRHFCYQHHEIWP